MQRYLLSRSFSRAKRLGLEFNITAEDITIPERCPVLGLKLASNSGDASPSVDRMDSTKGYVKGNVRVISWRANNLKSDATLVELIALGQYAATQSFGA
jgi:hypothetical protein